MNIQDRRSLGLAGLSILGIIASIVGLLVDLPNLVLTPVGVAILVLTIVACLSYLGYYLFQSMVAQYVDAEKRLAVVRDVVEHFLAMHANSTVSGPVDVKLIRLMVATKAVAQSNLTIIESRTNNSHIELQVDKGLEHGVRDDMRFKVLQSDRLEELGECGCTAGAKKSVLVIRPSPTTPLAGAHLLSSRLEVRPVLPVDNAKVNELIACVLHAIEGPR